MSTDVVIVFGVSGVGKTSACNCYASRHDGVAHVSAGELIKRAAVKDGEVLRTGAESEVKLAQSLLGGAFRQWRQSNKAMTILIDSHSFIDNDKGLIEISVEVVRELEPTAMVLLEASPQDVLNRRRADSRVRPTRDLAELQQQLDLSRKLCLNYSRELQIPLEVGEALNAKDFDQLIARAKSLSRERGVLLKA